MWWTWEKRYQTLSGIPPRARIAFSEGPYQLRVLLTQWWEVALWRNGIVNWQRLWINQLWADHEVISRKRSNRSYCDVRNFSGLQASSTHNLFFPWTLPIGWDAWGSSSWLLPFPKELSPFWDARILRFLLMRSCSSSRIFWKKLLIFILSSGLKSRWDVLKSAVTGSRSSVLDGCSKPGWLEDDELCALLQSQRVGPSLIASKLTEWTLGELTPPLLWPGPAHLEENAAGQAKVRACQKRMRVGWARMADRQTSADRAALLTCCNRCKWADEQSQ